ncbi:hypothetical protein RAS1_30840 [Phycisphaerae bacterium RAS1]|nr:hypothetical protein RAS1_30840 [Phycisphaerae bacterium RAS1]
MWWVVPAAIFTGSSVVKSLDGGLVRYLIESGMLSAESAPLVAKAVLFLQVLAAMLLATPQWRGAGWTLTATIAGAFASVHVIELSSGGTQACHCFPIQLSTRAWVDHVIALMVCTMLLFLSLATPRAVASPGRFRWPAFWLPFGQRSF